jgi:hypothetical protein
MVANAGQTPVLARPSPPIPTDVTGSLANYLRSFALWCQNGLAGKLSANTALPAIPMASPAGAPVWNITVDDSGRLMTTEMALGQRGAETAGLRAGTAGLRTNTFAPVTQYAKSAAFNPSGTTSAAYVMMGMALTLTPIAAAGGWITADGQITNSSNNSETDCVICFGAGVAPAWGDAQTGTILTQPARYKATAAGDFTPFSLTGVVSGLTAGTPYWFDIAVKTVSGGTAQIMDVDFSVLGLA